MLICLANYANSNPSLGPTIKQVKLKHSNMFVNIILNLIIYNIIFYRHMSKNMLICIDLKLDYISL